MNRCRVFLIPIPPLFHIQHLPDVHLDVPRYNNDLRISAYADTTPMFYECLPISCMPEFWRSRVSSRELLDAQGSSFGFEFYTGYDRCPLFSRTGTKMTT